MVVIMVRFGDAFGIGIGSFSCLYREANWFLMKWPRCALYMAASYGASFVREERKSGDLYSCCLNIATRIIALIEKSQ